MWKIITGDEKWIYYENPSNKKKFPVTTPKPSIHRQKFVLCVWWNMKGLKNHLKTYFKSKQLTFFRDGIHQWSLKRQKVNYNEGNYFDRLYLF